MLNAKDFNRKKFDDNWLGIVLPQSSQDRQMEGFGGYAIRRKVAIMGHTPSNRGEIDDKDVVFAIVALPAAGGGGGAGIKQTPRVFQGDVVYGTFLDKDTKQQPIILGLLGRTDKVKYEKGVYGRYDITSGFVGSLQPLKLFGRGQTNMDNRDCSPLSIPFEDAMRLGGEILSEKGGVPTEPTVGAIPPPPKSGETEVDPNIDEKITNAENAVQRLEDTQAAFDAQEAASEGSTDREAYEENEEKLNDARSEVNSLKEAKNTAEERLNATQQDLRDKLGFPLQTGANQEEVNRLKESLNKPVTTPSTSENQLNNIDYREKLADAEKRLEQYKIDGDTSKLQGIERKIEFYEKKLGIDSSSKFTDLSGRNETIQDYVSGYIPGDGKGGSTYSTSSDPHTGEPDFQTNREAWNEWNKKESQKLKDDPDSSGLDMF